MKHIMVSRLVKPFGSLVCLVGLLGGLFIAGSAASSFANETAGYPEPGLQLEAAFAVSGNVSSDQGPLNGVRIKFERVTGTGSVPPAVQTNIQGNWSQTGFARGTTYRANAGAVGFTFRPGSIEFRGSETGLKFVGLNIAFTASGIVRVGQTAGLPVNVGGGKPPGIEGVTITFSRLSGTGPLPAPVRTDAGGGWSQTGFQAGTTYRAAASRQGFTFNPPSIEISRPDIESGGPISGLIIEGSSITFSASGRVTAEGARGVPNVVMYFSRVTGTGAVPRETFTDEQGRWSQTGFERGTVYRIKPVRLPVDKFDPGSIDNLSNPPPNAVHGVSNQHFGVTIPKFRASGRVSTRTRGAGIANLNIVFSRRSGSGPVPASVTTNEGGEWSQQGFEMGTEYLATPTGTFSFTPTFVRFASIENPSERTRDISVPDTIAIGGRVTSTDSQLSRTAVVALQIRPVGGSPQEVFCVRTRVGVPWIKEGLDAARTYEVTPNALLAVAQRRGIVVEDHIELGLFGPPFVRVQGPKTDVNFTVSFDRVPGGIVQRSPCEP